MNTHFVFLHQRGAILAASLRFEKVEKLLRNDVVFVSLLIDLVFTPLEELFMVSCRVGR